MSLCQLHSLNLLEQSSVFKLEKVASPVSVKGPVNHLHCACHPAAPLPQRVSVSSLLTLAAARCQHLPLGVPHSQSSAVFCQDLISTGYLSCLIQLQCKSISITTLTILLQRASAFRAGQRQPQICSDCLWTIDSNIHDPSSSPKHSNAPVPAVSRTCPGSLVFL